MDAGRHRETGIGNLGEYRRRLGNHDVPGRHAWRQPQVEAVTAWSQFGRQDQAMAIGIARAATAVEIEQAADDARVLDGPRVTVLELDQAAAPAAVT